MDEQRYQVTRRCNRNGACMTAGRGLSLEAAAELAARLEHWQTELGGSDEYIVEVD